MTTDTPDTRSATGTDHDRDERLLSRFALAVGITTAIAWLVVRAMERSAEFDLTGQIETIMPLARIGLLTTPIVVGVRGAIATIIAWLVAGALNDRITMRIIAIGIVTWLPLLELPALVDAVSMLLQPQAGWADAHVPLGLDVLVQGGTPRMVLLTRTMNLALLVFTVLVARHLTRRVSAGLKVAVPTAFAVAAVLVVLPLLNV